MIFDIIIRQSSYNKAFKRYNDINDRIANFLYKSDNINKYRGQASEYLKITWNLPELKNTIDYTKYYNDSYKKLYNLFKDIIPELIQEEREKKLNKILVV